GFKRMIDADQRGSFGEPISLNDSETQPSPEFLGFAVECSASGNKSPEFQSELAMDATEHTPAAEKMLAFRGSILFSKTIETCFAFQIALNLFFQRFHHSRHRDQHGDSFAPDGMNDLGRAKRVLKKHGSSEQRRQVHS